MGDQSKAATIAAGIPVIGNLVSGVINAFSQGAMNRKTRAFQKEMYERQRADALADWNMQNAYNSPSQQMQRFKEAGLNPNLIYGQTNEGATVRSSSPGNWNPDPVDYGFIARGASAGLSAYYDMQLKESQNDLLKEQVETQQMEQIAKIVAAINTDQSTQNTKFDLEFKKEIRDISLDAAQMSLNKMKVETGVMLDRNEREAISNATSVYQAIESILNSRMGRAKTSQEIENLKAQLELLKKDNTIKELDVKLSKEGTRPTDPIWYRTVQNIIERWFGKVASQSDLIDSGKGGMKGQ